MTVPTATQFTDGDARRAIQETDAPAFEFITSPAEKLLAREFILSGGDFSRAYRVAYSQQVLDLQLTPAQIRHRAVALLAKPRVDEMTQYYRLAMEAKMDIREERILQELAAMAFSDLADLYEEDGQTLRNIHAIPKHSRHAISKFKTGCTKEGPFTEVQMESKTKALQMLISIKNMDGDNRQAKAPKVVISLEPSIHE